MKTKFSHKTFQHIAAPMVALSLSMATVQAAEPTRISVITQERWAPYVEQAVEQWNSAHPSQSVELDQLVLGYPQLRQKLITSSAAGKAPDFSLIDSVWVAEFASQGYLKAFDEIDSQWVQNDYNKDFYPVFVAGDSYSDKPYAIHTQTDMAVVWYRKDWFQAEGLEAPETWEDLKELSQHFASDATQERYGHSQSISFPAGLKAGEATTYQIMPFLWSNGADVFSGDSIVLDSPKTRQALAFLVDLVTDGFASRQVIANEWDRSMKLLATGRVAMSVGGSYENAMIKQTAGWSNAEFNQKIGFVPIPAGPNGVSATTAGGMAYSIFEQSENPELALEILKLATGPELMKEFVAATGQNSPRISVAESLDPAEHEFLVETGAFLYNAKARPVIPEYAKVSQQIQKMVENAVSGNMSVEQAVSKAANDISVITGLPVAE